MANPSPVPLDELVEMSYTLVPPPVARTVLSALRITRFPFSSSAIAPITRSPSFRRSMTVYSCRVVTSVPSSRSTSVTIISWPVRSPA